MKNLLMVIVVFTFALSDGAAQGNEWGGVQEKSKMPVGYDKATVLSFPFTVESFVNGNEDIITIQKKENLIFLRAKEEDMPETNVVVTLVNKAVYVFEIVYGTPKNSFFLITRPADQPPLSSPVAAFSKDQGDPPAKAWTVADAGKPEMIPAVEKKEGKKEALVEVAHEGIGEGGYESEVFKNKDYIRDLGTVDGTITAVLSGIWFKDEQLFFKVGIQNFSALPYETNMIGISLESKGGNKHRVVQKEPVEVVRRYHQGLISKGKEMVYCVLVTTKFTIPENTILWIRIFEKNGNRNFMIPVKKNDFEQGIRWVTKD